MRYIPVRVCVHAWVDLAPAPPAGPSRPSARLVEVNACVHAGRRRMTVAPLIFTHSMGCGHHVGCNGTIGSGHAAATPWAAATLWAAATPPCGLRHHMGCGHHLGCGDTMGSSLAVATPDCGPSMGCGRPCAAATRLAVATSWKTAAPWAHVMGRPPPLGGGHSLGCGDIMGEGHFMACCRHSCANEQIHELNTSLIKQRQQQTKNNKQHTTHTRTTMISRRDRPRGISASLHKPGFSLSVNVRRTILPSAGSGRPTILGANPKTKRKIDAPPRQSTRSPAHCVANP